MSYDSVRNLPIARRKVFLNNFNYFKEIENAKNEEEMKKANNQPSGNRKINFR